jgi:site-specific recombinase XerD
MSTNPLASVKRYRENASKLRWLNRKEEKAVRKAIRTDAASGAAHEAEFDLALNTGMRRGEQFFLEWRDCDLKRGKLTVKGKTGVRPIEANRNARAALRRLHKISGAGKYVSPDASDDVKRDARRWLEHAVKDAGIDHFRWHDLRHTFASRLVMAGVDIRTVQELLGHKSITMTMRYAHLAPSHLRAAVEKMNEEAPA